jgi:hypothetical protein
MSDVLAAALARLPAELKARIERIGAEGRGAFGRRQTQAIVAEHLDTLRELRDDCGASHADIAELLHLLGISAEDGSALSAGTVSSAISRAQAARGRKRPAHKSASPPRVSAGAARPDAAPYAPIRQPDPQRHVATSPLVAGDAAPAVYPELQSASPNSSVVEVARGPTKENPRKASSSVLHAAMILNLLDAEKGRT